MKKGPGGRRSHSKSPRRNLEGAAGVSASVSGFHFVGDTLAVGLWAPGWGGGSRGWRKKKRVKKITSKTPTK